MLPYPDNEDAKMQKATITQLYILICTCLFNDLSSLDYYEVVIFSGPGTVASNKYQMNELSTRADIGGIRKFQKKNIALIYVTMSTMF